MLIGTDRSLFHRESAVRTRISRLAQQFPQDAFESIVLSSRAHTFSRKESLGLNAAAYPTNSFTRLLYGWDAFRIAKKLSRPDVISAQDPFETGLAALLMADYFHVPFVVEVHTDFLTPSFRRHSLLNRLRLGIARFVLRRAAGVYVVSTRIKDALQKKYTLTVPIAVLPIFVDITRFQTITRTPEKGNVLWAGRFETEKNPDLALSAVAAAQKKGIHIRLTMLGAGRLEHSLKQCAIQLGIATQVAFPGWQDIGPYLSRAELLLVTSAYEGYGMIIVEALAAGVPVLATDVGIAREAGAIIAEGSYTDALRTTLSTPHSSKLQLKLYANEGEYFSRVHAFYTAVANKP